MCAIASSTMASAYSLRDAMCRCLRIWPSGFYAWLQAPLRKRAREDRCQNELLQKAWVESAKVYGYRKLHERGQKGQASRPE